MSAVARTLVLAALLAAGGCAARTPLALTGVTGAAGEFVTGSVPATVYTGLREAAQSGQACRGSYTGTATSSVVLLEIDCPDGFRGIGTGEMSGGKLVGGSVRMRDGQEAVVRVGESAPRS